MILFLPFPVDIFRNIEDINDRVTIKSEVSQLYRTIPVRAKFADEEQVFWIDQCQHANSLINSAIYHARQTHYSKLEQSGNAFTTYWRGDELRYGWKTYKCNTTYPELDKVLKDNPHYKALAAQAAQQTLKTLAMDVS